MNNHATIWLSNAKLVTPTGIRAGALAIRRGRIVGIRARADGSGARIDVRGRYVAPGFVDLHIWGEPSTVAKQEARFGTTSFLSAVGPESPEGLVNHLVQQHGAATTVGARCLGLHLEGPFLNPLRAGALASRWLRPPTSRELRQLVRYGGNRLRLMTLAPELPRGLETIRWCARRNIVVSLGHSDANDVVAERAIRAGATAVTHAFNGMRPLHHRDPGLLGEVLTDDRLAAMVILDGVHVDPTAFQLLLRCKGAERIVLVTDSIRHQHGKTATLRHGAYYLNDQTLAGSALTMMRAVRNAVAFGASSLQDAVRMATLNPARLIGEADRIGSLEIGKQADLVVFDRQFKVSMTFVDGQLVYSRK